MKRAPDRQFPLVIARSESDEAILFDNTRLDWFAEFNIGPATSGRTRWLAMTNHHVADVASLPEPDGE
jgi:hypothetical protein